MYKLFFVVCVILVSVNVQVNSLQCYQCLNCAKVTDNELVTCGEAATTTPTTVSPSTGTTQSSTGTTQPGDVSTQPSSGTTQPGESTSQTSAGTTQPSSGTTQPSSGTTQPSSGTTQPSSGTTQPGEVSTQPSSGTTQPGEGTSPTSAGTTQPSSGTTQPGEISTQPSSGTTQPVDVTSQPNNPEGPNADTDVEGSKAFEVKRFKRAIFEARADVSYVCATLKYQENNTDVIGRGCLLDQGDDNRTCSVLTALGFNGTCTICKTDKCNSASSLHVSALLILATFVVGSFYNN